MNFISKFEKQNKNGPRILFNFSSNNDYYCCISSKKLVHMFIFVSFSLSDQDFGKYVLCSVECCKAEIAKRIKCQIDIDGHYLNIFSLLIIIWYYTHAGTQLILMLFIAFYWFKLKFYSPIFLHKCHNALNSKLLKQ